MNNFINILRESNDGILNQISGDLVKERKKVLKYTNESIGDHILLIENWQKIVDAIICLRDEAEIKEFINNKFNQVIL